MKRPRLSPTGRLLLQVALVVLAVSGVVSVVAGIAFGNSIDANQQSFQRQLASAALAQQVRLHTAQVNGCSRTNARQLVTNKNGLATYRLNTLFAQAIASTPTQGQTAKQRRLTDQFRGRLLDTVASESWTPINRHCKKFPTAVLLPVPFSKRLPSKADLPVRSRLPPAPRPPDHLR